jgi:hypothetical protein
MSDTGGTCFRLGRLGFPRNFPPTRKDIASKPVVQNVLRPLRNAGRVSILLRVIFLEVFLLELRDCVLGIIGIVRSGFVETFLNLLSCLISLFLPMVPSSEQGFLRREVPGLPSTLQGV